MSDCCSNSSCIAYPKKAVCPVNGQTYQRVARETLLHHMRRPWQHKLPEQGYYFCDSPACDVVYFGEDKRIYTQADLRTPVGQKSTQADRIICYCFDVRQEDFTVQGEITRDFVIEQTRDGRCACEIRNPAGRCCLKDFPTHNHD